MKEPISVGDVVDEMEMLNRQSRAFLNQRTGELIHVSLEDLSAAEEETDLTDYPEWHKELIEEVKKVLESDDYLALPDSHEINQYGIMEDFCYSVEDERLREDLLVAIGGKGAFRRFEHSVRSSGIENDWNRYKREALEAIAIKWLKAHGIAYACGGDSGQAHGT